MPFIKVDAESFDEYAEEAGLDESQRPSEEFEYEPKLFDEGQTTFDPNTLAKESWMAGPATATLAGLRGVGVVRVRISYDGGYDEGFCRTESFEFEDGQTKDTQDVIQLLAKTDAPANIRAATADPQHDRTYHSKDQYAKMKDNEVAREGLDWLAGVLSSTLLGNGFGTGEYELYGAFTADLVQGTLTDDPNAEKSDEAE